MAFFSRVGMNKHYWLLLFLILSAILAGAYALLVEPRHIVVDHQSVTVKGWHARQAVVLAQLSDLHIGSVSDSFLQQIHEIVRAHKPDMILLTGDLLTSNRMYEKAGTPVFENELARLADWVERFHAPFGVYAVRGNHDFSDDKEQSDLFLDLLRRRGITVLTNQRQYIPAAGSGIYLLGVDYSGFGSEEVAKFPVRMDDKSRFIRSGPSTKNSYTHYYPLQDSIWHDYRFAVTFRMTKPLKSTIGLNVYSQYHLGYDRYYRLRWFPEEQRFHFSPHGTTNVEEFNLTAITLQPSRWYTAMVQVETDSRRTRMYGKIWPADSLEPNLWQISAWDSSASRLRDGTVGLYTNLRGIHEFDKVVVIRTNGDTLLQEDMENIQDGYKPPRWVDFNWNDQAIPMLAEGIPDSCLTVLLAHCPGSIKEAAEEHVDLELSGHTHGGQIYLPPLGAPWALTENGVNYVRGRHEVGSTILYINRGLGTTFLPIRFLCPPEITFIHLEPEVAPQTSTL